MFGDSCRPAKTTHQYFTLESPLPLPRPPKKKIHNLPKNVSPSNFPSPVWWPRDRFHGQSPSANPSSLDPCKGFPPKTRKWTRAGSIRNTHLNPSCHRTVRTTVVRPSQPGRVSTQWVRAIRSLALVRGLTRPSIPPPCHCREEKLLSNTFPESHGFEYRRCTCGVKITHSLITLANLSPINLVSIFVFQSPTQPSVGLQVSIWEPISLGSITFTSCVIAKHKLGQGIGRSEDVKIGVSVPSWPLRTRHTSPLSPVSTPFPTILSLWLSFRCV